MFFSLRVLIIMAYCKRFSSYLIKPVLKENRILVTRTRCKMWDCEYCAERNKSSWRRRVQNGVSNKAGYRWYFWTLTAHESDRSQDGSLANVNDAWQKVINIVRKRAKRDMNDFAYIRVYEAHKNGAIHIHALVGFEHGRCFTFKNKQELNEYIDPAYHFPEIGSYDFIPDEIWLAQQNRLAGGGYICDVKEIDGSNTAYVTAYVTKYFTKMERPLPKNCRRIQPSQGWIKPEKERLKDKDGQEITSGWEVRKKITETEALNAWRNNVELYDVQLKKQITTDDFETGFYTQVDK